MGCTHSKKNSKFSASNKVLNASDRPRARPEAPQQRLSSESGSSSSARPPVPVVHKAEARLEIRRPQPLQQQQAAIPSNIDIIKPSSDPASAEEIIQKKEAALETARAVEEKKRKRSVDRQRRHARDIKVPVNPYWDNQDENEYILRKNIQRNQRRMYAIEVREEADDTLYEVPTRMPEVDYTKQEATR